MFALRILKKTFFNSAPSVSNCEGEAIMFECPPHPLLCYAMRHHYDQPTTHIVTHVILSSIQHYAALRLNNNLHLDPCKNIPCSTTNHQCARLENLDPWAALGKQISSQIETSQVKQTFDAFFCGDVRMDIVFKGHSPIRSSPPHLVYADVSTFQCIA